MATKRITDLTKVTSVQDTDLLLVETSAGTRSVKKSDLVSDVIAKVNGINVPTALSQLSSDSTHRLVTDTEKSTWNAKVDTSTINTINNNLNSKAASNHTHAGGTISPVCIEFTPSSTSAGNGGYIDFHWNGSASDYTSRIIENASGSLYLEAAVGVKNSAVGETRVRNISAGTTDLTAGSSGLATGAIYIVYE